jgi:hypothetical protein
MEEMQNYGRCNDGQGEIGAIVEEMKSGAVSPSEFCRKFMGVLAALDVKDGVLQGITPQLLAFVNGLIKNMS